MRQGQGVKDRMSKELGHAIDVHGHVLWTFPAPDRLAHFEKFPGLFSRKIEYLNALGRAALAGEVDTEALRAMPREQALKSLQRLPGIGEWGSVLVRLRALSAVDELPSQERRLMGAVRTEYGLTSEPDQATLERLAEDAFDGRPHLGVGLFDRAGIHSAFEKAGHASLLFHGCHPGRAKQDPGSISHVA